MSRPKCWTFVSPISNDSKSVEYLCTTDAFNCSPAISPIPDSQQKASATTLKCLQNSGKLAAHWLFVWGGVHAAVSAAGLGAGWTTPSSPCTLRKLGNYLSNSSKLRHHDCGARVDFVGRSHTMSGIWYENESARLLIYSYMHMQLIFCPLAVWLVWLFWQGLVAASIRMENWAPVKIKYVCDIHTVIKYTYSIIIIIAPEIRIVGKKSDCVINPWCQEWFFFFFFYA